MKKFAFIALAIANPAVADPQDIQNHEVQKLFMEQPCAAVLARIDHATDDLEGMGRMAMAFGFLMGFEATHPGIRGDHETILKRLRADCTLESTETALDLLTGYAAQ